MKSRFVLPALAALVLLIAACAPPPVLRNDKYLHDSSILTGLPCEAPCWHGITPGVTSWNDAIAIINDDSAMSDPTIEEQEQARLATWQEVDGDPCCRLFSEDGDTVHSIILLLAPDNTLGELIEAHGEPNYVLGSEVTADQAVMNLFYLDPPMLVYTFVAGADSGALTERSELIGLVFTSKELMNELVQANSLYGWQGYESYRSYASSELAITAIPSATPTPGS